MIDASVPGSPGWWMLRLGKALAADTTRLIKLGQYAVGDHHLPEGDRRYRELFRILQRKARTNFVGLVQSSVQERLKVVGFRAGGGASDQTDDAAWQVWQASSMDGESGICHRDMTVYGRAYTMVGPPPKAGGLPVITVESPLQMMHAYNPHNRRELRAALKVYTDELQGPNIFAVLYLPDGIHYAKTNDSAPTPTVAPFFTSPGSDAAGERLSKATGNVASLTDLWTAGAWEIDTASGQDGADANEIGVVPVVPFINRPDVSRMGFGEFEDLIDIQDRMNLAMLDRLVISKMQAYRQRWAKGVSDTDENGNPQDQFTPGVDLLWSVEDENASFGDFEQADLSGVLAAIDSDINHMAAISRTPPHYLIGKVVNASGDALKAAETGLASKAGDRQTEAGESWEQTNRIAGLYQDRDVGPDAEVIWADAEARSTLELAAAAVQMGTAGVPWRQRMVVLGFSPQEIMRMDAERASDALLGALAAPPPIQPLGQAAAAQASITEAQANRPAFAQPGTS